MQKLDQVKIELENIAAHYWSSSNDSNPESENDWIPCYSS